MLEKSDDVSIELSELLKACVYAGRLCVKSANCAAPFEAASLSSQELVSGVGAVDTTSAGGATGCSGCWKGEVLTNWRLY